MEQNNENTEREFLSSVGQHLYNYLMLAEPKVFVFVPYVFSFCVSGVVTSTHWI